MLRWRIIIGNTVRPLVSAELYFSRFLRSKLSTPAYMKYTKASIIRTSIIRGPRLPAVFGTKI